MTPTKPGPEAPARLGPRPLALHLAQAMASGLGALAALPAMRAGTMPWPAAAADEAAALAQDLAQANPDALFTATAAAQGRRLEEMLAGIRTYQSHPYRRDLPAPAVLWCEGTTKLLDYGGDGPPALFVPSLINRYYVLDLTAERSLLRWLAERGVRALVVDWDAPGVAERGFDLDAYIAGRLGRLLDAVLERTGTRPVLVGYCLGGNLALGLASLRQADLAALALLATPWNFHAGLGAQAQLLGLMEAGLEGLLQGFGELPVDVLQALFAWLDPNLAARKFRRFQRLVPDSRAARLFVALEDWLNDGVPLAPQVARACLVDWYGRNRPMQGGWQLGGRPVRPESLELPTLLAIPGRDRIVPPPSAAALQTVMAHAQVLTPTAGHIGMMVGGGAQTGLWQPLLAWLQSLAK
ncbi:MAG: alpha/beta fold hydrolase [Alphaproteobacteria bacterium]|nr:alpha/beta fold hydrolase [Alphaproteobacteria bacterium]